MLIFFQVGDSCLVVILSNLYNLLEMLSLFISLFFLFADLNKNPVDGFSAGLIDESDIFKWEVLVMGPPDTF